MEVSQLNKLYRGADFALEDISFSIPYGAIVGFIGENGAGKTTTMGTILGTRKKSQGSIKLFGETIEDIKRNGNQKMEEVGVVFDDMNFSGYLTVMQLAKVMKHIYKQWDQKTYVDCIHRFRLPLKEKIEKFSRGMSMKLSIAVALSHDAKLLILDEATAGLDPVAREEVLEIFAAFVKDGTRSILLSSHMTSDIEKIATELIFIRKGKLILQASKPEMMDRYVIAEGTPEAWQQVDPTIMLARQEKEGKMEVLVSNENNLPPLIHSRKASFEEISLFLLKGENR